MQAEKRGRAEGAETRALRKMRKTRGARELFPVVPQTMMKQVKWDIRSAEQFIDKYQFEAGAYVGEGSYGIAFRGKHFENGAPTQKRIDSGVLFEYEDVVVKFVVVRDGTKIGSEGDSTSREVAALMAIKNSPAHRKACEEHFACIEDNFLIEAVDLMCIGKQAQEAGASVTRGFYQIVQRMEEFNGFDIEVEVAENSHEWMHAFEYIRRVEKKEGYMQEERIKDCSASAEVIVQCVVTRYLENTASLASDVTLIRTHKEAEEMALSGAEALAALHSLDIVHNDLRADNILIHREGRRRVAIIDFGLACEVDGNNNQAKNVVYDCTDPKETWRAPIVAHNEERKRFVEEYDKQTGVGDRQTFVPSKAQDVRMLSAGLLMQIELSLSHLVTDLETAPGLKTFYKQGRIEELKRAFEPAIVALRIARDMGRNRAQYLYNLERFYAKYNAGVSPGIKEPQDAPAVDGGNMLYIMESEIPRVKNEQEEETDKRVEDFLDSLL